MEMQFHNLWFLPTSAVILLGQFFAAAAVTASIGGGSRRHLTFSGDTVTNSRAAPSRGVASCTKVQHDEALGAPE
jgi:hypothetical protein